MLKFLIPILLALTTTSALAADPKPYVWPIYLSSQCTDDSVGERIVYKVREGLRKSAAMKVSDTYGDAAIHLSLICLDPTERENGSLSRYSFAITFLNTKGYYDFLLTHAVATCGTQRVDECSEDIVASLDKQIGKLISRIKDGSFKLSDP